MEEVCIIQIAAFYSLRARHIFGLTEDDGASTTNDKDNKPSTCSFTALCEAFACKSVVKSKSKSETKPKPKSSQSKPSSGSLGQVATKSSAKFQLDDEDIYASLSPKPDLALLFTSPKPLASLSTAVSPGHSPSPVSNRSIASEHVAHAVLPRHSPSPVSNCSIASEHVAHAGSTLLTATRSPLLKVVSGKTGEAVKKALKKKTKVAA